MTLSIITITYNNCEGMRKTLGSLQEQTHQDFEWIVIDGGSSDDTLSLLKDTKAFITSEPDEGIYDAMNKGIERMTGSHMLFLNAGDQLAHPECLEIINEYIARGAVFIYGDALEQDLDGTIHEKIAKPYTNISKGLFTHHQAMIYAKSELRYDLQYKIASDFEFTYRFLRDIVALDLPIYYIPQPLCIFEGGGVSQTNAKLGRQEQYRARQTHNMQGAKIIYVRQSAAWMFRRFFPNAFWKLKGLISKSHAPC